MKANSIEKTGSGPSEDCALRRRFPSWEWRRFRANGFLAALALFLTALPSQSAESVELSWDQADEILARIHAPEFPNREFNIVDYGAIEGGEADCTEAFAKAIEACHDAGGGRVVVPAGTFLTGAIHLKSNVNLHLTANSIVKFSADTQKYLPVVFTRWEGLECMNYSPFIYAYEQENIAVTGRGTLDGQADNTNWWPWCGKDTYGWEPGAPRQNPARNRLNEMGESGVPVAERVMGEGHYLRPNFIQPYKCRNVLIEGVTIKNSPMWEIHPVLSENVIVRAVTVTSHGPNNDGCDPESCRDVLIQDCHFDTGDDCIALKSGRNNDGRRVNVPIENVIVRDCTMKDGHGGVVIGSEISGGCRNIFVENCRMDSPNLDRALRIKTNSKRGGLIENIYFRNVEVGQVGGAVARINFMYEEGDAGDHLPVVRNVLLENVTCRKSRYPLYIRGYERSPIRNLKLVNCTFESVERPSVLEGVADLQLIGVTQRQ